MREDKKVQFVCFETALDKEPFLKRWEQFSHSLNSNVDVTLQQSEKNGVFRYIAQHRFTLGELQFVFSKEGRTSRNPVVQIKTSQVGGYSILQAEYLNKHLANERKVFVFMSDARVDLKVYNSYKKSFASCKLNIYEAYYENCKYAYILEYFVKAKDSEALQKQLNLNNVDEAYIYKECTLSKNQGNTKANDFYVWPT